MVTLAAIVLGCLGCELFIPKDPAYMDLFRPSEAPGPAFWFGSDPMGRDIFSMIWYGGRLPADRLSVRRNLHRPGGAVRHGQRTGPQAAG